MYVSRFHSYSSKFLVAGRVCNPVSLKQLLMLKIPKKHVLILVSPATVRCSVLLFTVVLSSIVCNLSFSYETTTLLCEALEICEAAHPLSLSLCSLHCSATTCYCFIAMTSSSAAVRTFIVCAISVFSLCKCIAQKCCW